MTALWTPVPLWLSLDGGVRSLPAPARVALYELAVNGGGARCGDDPSEALDGLCAGAGASLGAMLARRVVAVEGGRLRLVAPDGAAPARAAAEAPPPSGADAPKADDSSPRVYFVQAVTGGPIKIGRSVAPESRLTTLQTANAAELRILATIPGDISTEQALHAMFAADRVRPNGEWFHPSYALVSFVRRAGGDPA